MKIGGMVLMWVGIVALLKNMGFIEVVDWNIIWPVALIILGMLLKHHKRCGSCGSAVCMGGKCGGNGHVCEGPNRKH
jgi:hypothetical protein